MPVRSGRPTDAEGLLTLRSRVFPYRVMALADVRSGLDEAAADERFGSFAVEDGDRLIGWGAASPGTWSPDPGEFHVLLVVHPEFRRQGIGTTLAEAVDAHLAKYDARRTLSSATEDGVEFALRQGFQATDVLHYARTDPRLVPDPPAAPAGVELTNLAALDLESVYAAFVATAADVPGDQDFGQIPLEVFEREVWKSAGLNRELSTAAVADGKVVCFTTVLTTGDRLWTDMTGTLSAYRGRGLAKVVKTIGLRAAAAAGITSAYTVNHDVNRPMRAINEWLGYSRVASHTGMVRMS
ncbi:GNAT family N-acetyltransferase [Kribbella qitaiheensis]|uniref:GNAT family N-acetyltransferase n=1 Tax=Kribbella qitaiheensis TaxID=1544730 RepID=A0A7G6X5I6_9ACTN|nr:GNAT family N-acetyltransferase [Kribbella qitaiheensis]QNE21501.1 GNAT family N-acetyltransferase [Kribbella qitaiheensis]